MAGIWKPDGEVVTLEPFGRLTKERRAELVEETERTLKALHGDDGSYDIRFGTVAA